MSLHYEYLQSGKIELFIEEVGKLEATFEFRNFKFLGNFEIDLQNKNFSKSAYLSFDYRKSGVFEFVIKDNEETLEIAISDESLQPKSRKIRAIVTSTALGSTEINMWSSLTQGIFVFSSKTGIHKLSYNIDMKERILVTINVESPYLNNGFSSITFSINQRRKIYDMRFSSNNDHFVFFKIKIKDFGFESRFDVETTYFPEKLSSEVKFYFNQSQLMFSGNLKYSVQHSVQAKINLDDVKGNIEVGSPLIPYNHISFGLSHFMVNNETEFKFYMNYGEEYFEIKGRLHDSKYDKFDGTLSFSSSEFSILKLFVSWSLDLINCRVVLNIETSIPSFSTFFIKSEMMRGGKVGLVTLIKLPIPGHEFYQVEIDLTDRHNIILDVKRPQGMFVTLVNWKITGTGTVIKCKSTGPFGELFHFLANIEYEKGLNLHIDTSNPFMGRTNLQLKMEEFIQKFKNKVDFKLRINRDFVKIEVPYDFVNTFECSAQIRSSFHLLRSLGLVIGFENTERKMLKAHLNYFEQCVGIEFDYFFHDIKNMTILLRLDNPFEDWSNIYFELSCLITSKVTKAVAGINLYDNSLGSNMLYQNGKATFNVNYYDERLSFNYEVEDKSFDLFLDVAKQELFINFKTMKIDQKTSIVEFNARLNGEKKLCIFVNKFLNKFSVQVNDIYFPFSVDLDFTMDTTVESIPTFATNLIFSWENSSNKRSALQFGFTFGSGGDVSVSLKYPDRSLYTIRILQYSLTSISVLFLEISAHKDSQTKETLLRVQSNKIIADNLRTKERSIQIYSNKYQQKVIQTERKHGKCKFEYFGWGENDNVKGVGYITRERRSGNFHDSEILFFHQIGRLEHDILAVTLKQEDKYFMCDIHFSDQLQLNEFSIKTKSNFVDSPRQLRGFLLFGYTRNKSKLRKGYKV